MSTSASTVLRLRSTIMWKGLSWARLQPSLPKVRALLLLTFTSELPLTGQDWLPWERAPVYWVDRHVACRMAWLKVFTLNCRICCLCSVL